MDQTIPVSVEVEAGRACKGERRWPKTPREIQVRISVAGVEGTITTPDPAGPRNHIGDTTRRVTRAASILQRQGDRSTLKWYGLLRTGSLSFARKEEYTKCSCCKPTGVLSVPRETLHVWPAIASLDPSFEIASHRDYPPA